MHLHGNNWGILVLDVCDCSIEYDDGFLLSCYCIHSATDWLAPRLKSLLRQLVFHANNLEQSATVQDAKWEWEWYFAKETSTGVSTHTCHGHSKRLQSYDHNP